MPLLRSILLCALAIAANRCVAAPVQFMDESAFNTAVSGRTITTVNFDSVIEDTPISSGTSFDGLDFTYNPGLGADELNIVYGPDSAFGYETTSAPAYLGNDADELLGGGVSFTISSLTGFDAFSFQVIAPDQLVFEDDVQISVAGSTFNISNAGFTNELFINGVDDTDGYKYFIGIQDTASSFNSVTITTPADPGGSGYFGIDDIQFAAASAVPEPSSLAVLAIVSVVAAMRRRGKTSPPATL